MRWYEQRILELDEPFRSILSSFDSNSRQISIVKKRQIAEMTFKILLAFEQKNQNATAEFIDRCRVKKLRFIFLLGASEGFSSDRINLHSNEFENVRLFGSALLFSGHDRNG